MEGWGLVLGLVLGFGCSGRWWGLWGVSCSAHLRWSARTVPSGSPVLNGRPRFRHRRCPSSHPPSVSGVMMPQPWGLLCARSSATACRTSLPSYREDSLVHWGAREATAPCTWQLYDDTQKLLVQQIKNKEGFSQTASGTQTLYNFRQEVCSSFVLLHPVALHDLTITVDTNIPAAARLRLTVEHGGVRNVVVLEHALLELTLRSEVLLERNYQEGCFHLKQTTRAGK